MFPETTVLGGDECIDDEIGQVIVIDQDTTPLSDLFYKAAVAAENPEWDLQRNITDRFRFRQTGRDIVIGAYDGCRHGHHAAEHKAHEPHCHTQLTLLAAQCAGFTACALFVSHGRARFRANPSQMRSRGARAQQYIH